MLVGNSQIAIPASVQTTELAPTIPNALRLDPMALQAVKSEGPRGVADATVLTFIAALHQAALVVALKRKDSPAA